MIDRRLWDEEVGDALERELLLSMREDGAPPDARRRTLAALGLVGAGAAVPVAVVAKKGLFATIGSKIVYLLLTVALVGSAALAVRKAGRAKATRAPAPVVTAAPSVTAPVPSTATEPATESSAVPRSVVAPAPAAKPAAPSPSTAEAIALLDATRKSLDRGDLVGAVNQLDKFDERFPKGPLRPEADLLRIETLVRLGDRESAQKIADDIAMKMPGSAHAQRAFDLMSKMP